MSTICRISRQRRARQTPMSCTFLAWIAVTRLPRQARALLGDRTRFSSYTRLSSISGPEASAEEVWRGLYEAVPNADGTEVIIESTCDKPGGRFHSMIKAAREGNSEFELLFVPWFIHDEYRTSPPDDWYMPEAFQEYMKLHDLDVEQVYWAWTKTDQWRFLSD